MNNLDLLTCPLDGLILKKQNRQFVCSNGHNFDIARPNYINLLLVQHKQSKQPGDNQDMVQARKEFLDYGLYTPLLEAIHHSILGATDPKKNLVVFDAACGEGYYLHHLAKSLGIHNKYIGMDISKWAIKTASQRNKELTWVVASNKQIPLLDSSIDIVLSLFGYPIENEFKRILKPRGLLLIMEPAANHLIELRQRLYTEIKADKSPRHYADLETVDKKEIHFQHELNQQQLCYLLKMTPHFYRARKEQVKQISTLEHLNVSFHVSLRVLANP